MVYDNMPAVLSKPVGPDVRRIPETRTELACLTGHDRDKLLKTVRAYDRRSGQPGWLTQEMGEFMSGSAPVAPDGWKIKEDGMLGEAAWRAAKRYVVLEGATDSCFIPGLGNKPCGCRAAICGHVKMMR